MVWSGGRRLDLGIRGWPTAVNDHGVAVGTAFPAKPTTRSPWKVYAFRWSKRRGVEPLPRYGLVMSSALRVTDLNEAGQITGHDDSGPLHLTGTRLERPPHGSAWSTPPRSTSVVTSRARERSTEFAGRPRSGRARALSAPSGRSARTLPAAGG